MYIFSRDGRCVLGAARVDRVHSSSHTRPHSIRTRARWKPLDTTTI